MSQVFQLRIYEVSSDKRQQFHDRFKNNAMRIMGRYDFKIIAMWESTSVSNFEFIYILQWPDTATMERQWAAFLADPEWIEIKRRMAESSGEPVQKATGRVLTEIPYFLSPVLPNHSACSASRGE